MSKSVQEPALRGLALLHNSSLNRGSAFSLADRRKLGIEGFLPAVPDTIETQIARVHLQLSALDNDLQKYLFLSDLQSRNKTLFYAVLMADPAAFMPLVYTPTVGEAREKSRPHLSGRTGFIFADYGQGTTAGNPRHLAPKRCALYRRDRWRTHLGSR